ncbi:MAG: ABC transporter permease [Sedimentisphaerales bacterium]|nr:ABC transporter permease [Sedimentisphaerales bacterium]
MNGFLTVCKRELKSYFTTPLAYVFLVIFLVAIGFLTFNTGRFLGVGRFYENRQADMRVFFQAVPILFIFLAPCTAMRLWAEERRTGSIELLLTLPITPFQAVLGKFVAAWIFLAIALALTFPMPLTVCYLGSPDLGLIITGYLAAFLMAGAYLAIGSFFSALTKNQVISFILSVVACAFFYYAGLPSIMNLLASFLPAAIVKSIQAVSLLDHYESLLRGVIEIKDIIYFLGLIVAWILSCTIILNQTKAA